MKYLKIGILIFISFLIASCANTKNIDNQNLYPRVVFENSLESFIDIKKVNYFKKEDGFLLIEASFYNTSSFNKKIAYKIEWLDEHGFVEKSLLSRWVFKEIDKEGMFLINSISPSPKTKDFRIIMRLDPDDNTTIRHNNENFNN